MRRTGLLPLLTFLLVAALPGPTATGQAAKLDPAAMDRLVDSALYDVLKVAVPLYNAGEVEGGYRLLEGALMSVKPLLAHRPELQREINAALISAARANVEADKRAWVLRETIDAIRGDLRGKAPVVPVTPGKGTTVSGIVSVDAKGPLPSGRVVLYGPGPDFKTYPGPIAEGGKYSIDKVPVGEYKIVIAEDPKSAVPIEAAYLDVKTTPLALKVTDPTPVTFNFGVKGAAKKAGGSAQGKITVDGKPLAEAGVVFRTAGQRPGIAKTAADGTYLVKDLAAGSYKVQVLPGVGGPMLDDKYQNAETTPLKVEVAEDKPTTFDIDLKTGEKKPEPEALKVPPMPVPER